MVLASASSRVVGAHRSLIVLPALSLLLTFLVIGVVLGPTIYMGEVSGGEQIILTAIAMLLCGAVQAYFHAAVTIGAVHHFDGGRPTVSSTTSAATALLPLILGWAVIGWLVSSVMAMVRNRVPFIGPLVANLGEALWGVVTYLAMPVMVVERSGPVRAIRRSAKLLRDTWGENLLAQIGVGIYAMVLLVPVAFVALLASILHPWLAVALGVAGVVGVVSYMSALDAVFRVALYRYITTGERIAAFDEVDFEGAFSPKSAGRAQRW